MSEDDLPSGLSGLNGLDERRREWTQAAWRYVDPERLAEIVTGLVDVPSPTGDEVTAAEHIAGVLTADGIEAHTQRLDDRQANAWGRIRGNGDGCDLMLYAPIDTVTAGVEAEDLPWIGPELRDDMRPRARRVDDYVIGLGASNPKGHAACVLAAAEAIDRAGITVSGDLLVAFGAGGMPTNARPRVDNPRHNTGQGVGCSFLLEQGVWADYALIAKPGWTVSWEEVGLSWYRITVHGTHTYVGSRQRLPYANAIDLAGQVVRRLEDWFGEYAEAHTDGLVAPQGVVSQIEGGWARTASFTPEQCTFSVDLRLSPRTTPQQAKRELRAALDRIATELGDVRVDCEQVLAIPGEGTDSNCWLCRDAVAAWEAMEGCTHEPILGNSGATDANILRNRGIPTVRVGMPKVANTPFPVDFAMGMNAVDVVWAEKLTRYLIRVAIDTLTRTRAEVGID